MSPHVHWSVGLLGRLFKLDGWSVGWLVCLNFLKELDVTLPCSYRSNFLPRKGSSTVLPRVSIVLTSVLTRLDKKYLFKVYFCR